MAQQRNENRKAEKHLDEQNKRKSFQITHWSFFFSFKAIKTYETLFNILQFLIVLEIAGKRLKPESIFLVQSA